MKRKETAMWDNNEYSMTLEEGSIYEYERIMLSSGACRYLIPMTFIDDARGRTAYYECADFIPIRRFRIDCTEDAFYILEKTLIILSRMSEYLITPSRMVLNSSTVFYNRDTGEIKIAYVPSGEGQRSLRNSLVRFITEIGRDIGDGFGSYLADAARYIYYSDRRAGDIINKIGMYRREIFRRKNEKGIR